MDTKSKKSLNAAFWYMLSSFISKALLYIFTPLYTRLLTTAQYGQYNNFLSWQNILITLLTFDLGAAITIAFYDYDNDEEFNAFVSTITVFSYIIPGFFCTFIYIFRDFFSEIFKIPTELIPLLVVYITFNNTLNIFQSDQRVRLKYKASSFLTLGASTASVIVTLILALTFKNKIIGILCGGIVVNVFISFILAIYILKRNKTIRLSYLKYALTVAVPLVPHVLAGTILGSSDKVMITRYCGEEMNALYSLAYTVSLVVTMVASSINKAWVPWFFDRLKTNVLGQIRKVSEVMVGTIALLSVGICLLAPEIMHIIGGQQYVIGADVMPPIILSCLVNCISTLYINIEFYNKKTTGISIATVVTAIINLLLNYIFIQQFGYIAAAYTTLFSSALALAFHLYKVKKQKMLNVFNNKHILGITIISIVVCETLLLTYSGRIVRYIILGGIVIVFLILITKHISQIKTIMHTIIPQRK